MLHMYDMKNDVHMNIHKYPYICMYAQTLISLLLCRYHTYDDMNVTNGMYTTIVMPISQT